jgi:predicted Zn-dependent protease
VVRTLTSLTVVLGVLGAGTAYWLYHTTRLEYRLRRAEEALCRGDWDEVERLALRLESTDHENQAHLLRGKLFFGQAKPYLEAGQPGQVLSLLKRSLDEFNQLHEPAEADRLEAAALSGKCLLFLNEPAEAERVLRFVVDRNPDHVDAHRALAALYFDQGALARAIMHCEEWARLDPRDGRPYRFMGHIYKELDYTSDAARCFQAALERELGERFAEDAKENLAAVQVRQSGYSGAWQTLQSCAPSTSDKSQVTALRVECLWGLGRHDDACSIADRALEKYPDSVELLRLRAKFYLYYNQPRNAATLLERAVGIDRHDETSRDLLAQAYEQLNRPAEAAEQRRLCQQTRDYLKEMTTLRQEGLAKPWDASIRQRLAGVCEKLDKPQLAAKLRKTLAASPAAQAQAHPEPGR